MLRKLAIASLVTILAMGLLISAPAGAAQKATTPLAASLNLVGGVDGGGEPSIASAKDGTLYVSAPAAVGTAFWRSTTGGKKWSTGGIAQTSSGDTSVNVDSSGAVYQSNLGGPGLLDTLQGTIYKSFNKGQTWPQVGSSLLSSSNSTSNPFFVDRQWVDAYIPPGKTTNEAQVYIQYHDFVPSQIWVNASTDGGRTFGLPVDVINDPMAEAASFCSTIPGGIKVVQSGPHAGRIYVAWIAADPLNVLTGCNITMLQAFHTVWSAYSDDGGQTWTDKLVFDAGFFHDGSELFADLTMDNKGNPYVAFAMNINNQFDIWVSASFDGGNTWKPPSKVDSDVGTHYFPAVAVGDPGKVFVVYLGTNFLTPTLPNGKPQPNGDASAYWNVFLGQSTNFLTPRPTWKVIRVTKKPMHHGDICTLGIFCLPGTNRNLLDFIDITIDPKGFAHAVYTDDLNYDPKAVVSANQTGGALSGKGGH
jgi:hypothetical protein